MPSRAHGAGPLPVRSPLPSPPHMSIKYFQNVICRLAAGQGANRRFQIMFRKFCFRKQAAGGFRRRGPTRRAFARCVRCRCTGFFSAVGRACLARHGAALIVGLAAPRRPRRQPRRLQLLVRGLRLPAASCLVGAALQPHIVAAWRRPPRGAPAGPRCPGRMRSGRPFKVADACCGLVHAQAAQRPSGEYGLRRRIPTWHPSKRVGVRRTGENRPGFCESHFCIYNFFASIPPFSPLLSFLSPCASVHADRALSPCTCNQPTQ